MIINEELDNPMKEAFNKMIESIESRFNKKLEDSCRDKLKSSDDKE